MTRLAALAFPLLLAATACAEVPEHVELTPEAQNVEFAYEPPSPEGYKEVGKVEGLAVGEDAEAALEAAKNDLRNKAAALGAAVVTIDQNLGEGVPLSKKMKAHLYGRAFKAVE
jgi:hypothetical protein